MAVKSWLSSRWSLCILFVIGICVIVSVFELDLVLSSSLWAAKEGQIAVKNSAFFEESNSSNPFAQFIPDRSLKANLPIFTDNKLTEREGWDFQFNHCPPSIRQAREWQFCDPSACKEESNNTGLRIQHPPFTASGINTLDFIDKVLLKAWGPEPPLIDLYVRTGCRGRHELLYLLETVQLFWPRHLGRVLVVLDYNDRLVINTLIPDRFRKTHSYLVVYEHVPCMDGRLFNQYSYLNLYRYTQAEYAVTIDSDCAFHAPVTPDLLFNEDGKLRLATSNVFQNDYNWDEMQEFFTNISHAKWGHPMITQPISFHVSSTFRPYMDWIARKHQTCYEQLLIDLPKQKSEIYFFCWMCQLLVFVGTHPEVETYYDIHNVETRRDLYLRFAVHVTYELAFDRTYEETVQIAVNEGLCRWFGMTVFPKLCSGPPRTNYLTQVTAHYARTPIMLGVTHDVIGKRIKEGQARIKRIIDLV